MRRATRGIWLMVATVLTLFFVPYLYAFLDDLRAAFWRYVAYVWPRTRVA